MHQGPNDEVVKVVFVFIEITLTNICAHYNKL